MSLQLYSQIPGTQVKRDVDLSNATIQCDPKLLFPLGATQGGVPLNKENLAGKIAVEHDICNLDVNNLTVNGVLKVKGPAEVCNIVCPEDFRVTARNDTILESGNDIALLAGGELVTQSAGAIIESTVSTTIISTGTGAGQGSINLSSSANSTGTGGQIVLNANSSANSFGNAGVKIQGNNTRSTTATGLESGGSLNVFPQVAGAKGLHVVCRDTVAGQFGIAADLTGTTILRSDDGGLNTGATGHLCFAPSSASGSTNIDPTINVGGGSVQAGIMLANSADACGRFELTLAVGAADTATLTFAKPYPTAVTNVFISPANVAAANAFLDGYFVQGTDTDFTLSFPNGISAAAVGDAQFDYFVVDVVEEGQQVG